MNRVSITLATVLMTTMAATTLLANATVEQKTQVHLEGAIGAMVNVFGGRAARDGVTSSTAVHGNRKLTTTGSSGTIVDLKEERVYTLDYDRKRYKVETFDEIRRRMEDARKRSERSSGDDRTSKKNEGPEYEVDFAVKSTGAKASINGWNTHQEIVTVTVHEKGKTLQAGGGAVLTSDMWMGPKIAAFSEVADFDRRYYEKLYNGMFSLGDMQQMATMMAATPAFAKAMKVFGEKKGNLEGTAIRTALTFETVAGPGGANSASDDSARNSSPASVLGGFLGRSMRKKTDDGRPSDPNRSTLFTSNTEILKATAIASAEDVAMPAGFVQK
ncbi:MAG: hypothetical protein JWO56_2334 [Acidobacteria bacterium]|nr:hypothetical protein [Acidobacteriota bacterium]